MLKTMLWAVLVVYVHLSHNAHTTNGYELEEGEIPENKAFRVYSYHGHNKFLNSLDFRHINQKPEEFKQLAFEDISCRFYDIAPFKNLVRLKGMNLNHMTKEHLLPELKISGYFHLEILHLRDAYLGIIAVETLPSLKCLTLEKITVKSGKIDLNTSRDLEELTLELSGNPVILKGIRSLKNLRGLHASSQEILFIELGEQHPKMKQIALEGQAYVVGAVKGLTALESVSFYDAQTKKNYQDTAQELQAIIAQRSQKKGLKVY